MKPGFLITVRTLFVLYVAAVCYLCFMDVSFAQNLDVPDYLWGIRNDRIVHFVMFLPYPVLAIPVFSLSRKSSGLKIIRSILIIISGIAFSAATELIQNYFIEAREGDVMDFGADVSGLAAGLVLFFIISTPIIRAFRD